MSSSNSDELDTLVLTSFGRCPEQNVLLNRPVNRVCPLAYQVFKLRRDRHAPQPFVCQKYIEHRCPLSNRMQTLMREESKRLENPQTREDIALLMRPHNRHSRNYVTAWLSKTPNSDLPQVGRAIAATIKATDNDKEYAKFVDSFPHDNQCCLYFLLGQPERK